MKHNRFGFTIVELLIVIVVIGILAAISIVAYNGISNQANDSAVKNDLANNAKKLNIIKTTSSNDLYPAGGALGGLSERLKFSKSSYMTSSNAVLYCLDADANGFAIIGKSKSGKAFYVRNDKSVTEFPHNFPVGQSTDCPNAGSAGVNGGWPHSVPAGWASWVD